MQYSLEHGTGDMPVQIEEFKKHFRDQVQYAVMKRMGLDLTKNTNEVFLKWVSGGNDSDAALFARCYQDIVPVDKEPSNDDFSRISEAVWSEFAIMKKRAVKKPEADTDLQ